MTQTTKEREELANAVGADISGYYDADAFIQTYTFNDAQLEALLHQELQKARVETINELLIKIQGTNFLYGFESRDKRDVAIVVYRKIRDLIRSELNQPTV